MDRRSLLIRIVQGFSVTGALFLTYPFLKAWFPSLSEDLGKEVDIGDLKPGQSIEVSWLGRHVMIVRRTAAQLRVLEAPGLELRDAGSIASRQPAYAANEKRSRRADIFVAFSNCTHLGCEVSIESADPAIGFTCPCHKSRFDPAGRVEKSAAAPRNLDIPEYQYLSRNQIRLIQS